MTFSFRLGVFNFVCGEPPAKWRDFAPGLESAIRPIRVGARENLWNSATVSLLCLYMYMFLSVDETKFAHWRISPQTELRVQSRFVANLFLVLLLLVLLVLVPARLHASQPGQAAHAPAAAHPGQPGQSPAAWKQTLIAQRLTAERCIWLDATTLRKMHPTHSNTH